MLDAGVTTGAVRKKPPVRAPSKPSQKAPAPKQTSPRQTYTHQRASSGSSRGYSSAPRQGARSGGGGTPRVITPPKPVIPGVNQYLKGDTVYQDQLAQLRKALAQYKASQMNDQTNYNTEYATNNKSLGEARTHSFADLQDDYAGRGLLNSGVYGSAYSDLQSDYDNRQVALNDARTAYLNGLTTNLTNFQGDQTTTATSAKQEAIARRAAKYGG